VLLGHTISKIISQHVYHQVWTLDSRCRNKHREWERTI